MVLAVMLTSFRKMNALKQSCQISSAMKSQQHSISRGGLIVLTSCSHRGVINAIKRAQAASGVNKVHAVIGGFHLAPYKEDYVRDTVAAIKDMGIDYVVPLHCTGEPFYEMAKAEIPNKLLRSYTGTRFVFSA